MIGDPYVILGVSRTASDEEVKKAYRELSRKYHPDSYGDNPLSGLAEEKFKEVQEAYDKIMNERQYGGYTSTNSYHSYQDSNELAEVAALINGKRFHDAVAVLAGISNRTARWYYYSAVSNLGLGNNMIAVEHSRTAASMEPNNPDYISLVNQLSYGNQNYQNRSYNYGRRGMDTGDMCCNLCIADACCECMGGDLCTCI